MNPENLIKQIRESFYNSVSVYTEGSCYRFHLILKEVFPDAEPWHCIKERHTYTKIGDYFYDIRGKHEREDLEPLESHPGLMSAAYGWLFSGQARCKTDVPVKELIRRLKFVALLDPYGKLHYYNDYCRFEELIDESGNIKGAHEMIASKLKPDYPDPLTALWKLGWVKYIGWMSCSDSPGFHNEPTQAQFNTMFELGIKSYSDHTGVHKLQ